MTPMRNPWLRTLIAIIALAMLGLAGGSLEQICCVGSPEPLISQSVVLDYRMPPMILPLHAAVPISSRNAYHPAAVNPTQVLLSR